jgi:hypothetical protein
MTRMNGKIGRLIVDRLTDREMDIFMFKLVLMNSRLNHPLTNFTLSIIFIKPHNEDIQKHLFPQHFIRKTLHFILKEIINKVIVFFKNVTFNYIVSYQFSK